jgi:hypothetical protein
MLGLIRGRFLSTAAVALLIGSIVTSAVAQFGANQPCNTSSLQFSAGAQAGAETEEGAAAACYLAIEAVEELLIAFVGVRCGPCPFPKICAASLTNLGGEIMTDGPYEGPPGTWSCVASYEGTFHVFCASCQSP